MIFEGFISVMNQRITLVNEPISAPLCPASVTRHMPLAIMGVHYRVGHMPAACHFAQEQYHVTTFAAVMSRGRKLPFVRFRRPGNQYRRINAMASHENYVEQTLSPSSCCQITRLIGVTFLPPCSVGQWMQTQSAHILFLCRNLDSAITSCLPVPTE